MSNCNHTSVGMLVWRSNRLLLIERGNVPYGFAPPAGHVYDGERYETAAARELEEEVNLEAIQLKLAVEGRKENACRQPNGTWHYWRIYQAQVTGTLRRSLSETKKAGFYSKTELQKLANRTELYLQRKVTEEDWQASPGLEPVWLEWFKQMRIL